ncbi:class I SAM-dependent methyltransferase [Thioalkalivibrio sp. ALJ24]|uniref:class I SAM-dependent methyltransferase n=1 Tax=Thioalkalivibrio sp. ALJ24 TaxID=545276 RepID=UPI00035D7B35|nr:class I SAM-dependent methyltransferase [Thioalkalivibrio sp. ALJ24]
MPLELRPVPQDDPRARERARALQERLDAAAYAHAGPAVLVLEVEADCLSLVLPGGRTPLRLTPDFVRGRQGYRHARASHETLVRAVGRIGDDAHVVDASAGLGRDTLLLAARGWRVSAFERHPVVALLLEDALQRAAQAGDPALAASVARVHLFPQAFTGDALPAPADAAVFDPMFPQRRKNAAVKKDMQVLQALMDDPAEDAEENDAAATLVALIPATRGRVVVKRPAGANPLPGGTPVSAIEGRAVRFDLYRGTRDDHAEGSKGDTEDQHP